MFGIKNHFYLQMRNNFFRAEQGNEQKSEISNIVFTFLSFFFLYFVEFNDENDSDCSMRMSKVFN